MKKIKNFRLLFVLLLTTIMLSFCGKPQKQVQQNAQVQDSIWTNVDVLPEFVGGDAELLKFIAINTQYPTAAKENNIQGKVIVKFCVTYEGIVNNVSVLKGVDTDLDKESIRVVQTLPKFTPGKKDGKDVSVWYMIPITFTLK